ncbi:DUF1269 domain-containing protein [Enterococcus songbeiensis]|nr:DUF1269 domain-containing protein [Enterococcus songbeiensis]
MTKRVIVMNFEVTSQAYQAFSEIKKLAAQGAVKGEQMAVVTHSVGDHKFSIDDFLDFTGSNKTSKGGLIGMLVGILGGPLGVLLGWFGGSMIGATQDAKEIKDAQNVFEFVINQISEGQTGLILIADEEDNRPINQVIINELGGGITRLELEDVEEEVRKAREVEKNTQENAKKDWQSKHEENSATAEINSNKK